MAPSLQALIDFLLAEIALCGDQGMSSLETLFDACFAYACPFSALFCLMPSSCAALPGRELGDMYILVDVSSLYMTSLHAAPPPSSQDVS